MINSLKQNINNLLYLILLCFALMSTQLFAEAVRYIGTQANTDTALNAVSDVVVSADGKFVYTASTSSSAVSIFSRDLTTGVLTYVSKTTGISAAFSVDVSSDNKSLYAASPTGQEIVAFSRDVTTGALTLVNRVKNTGGSSGFVSVSVSPDNKHVYGVGGYPNANGLVVFERNESTGALTVLHDYKDNVNDHALGQLFSNTTSPIKNIVTSADGRFVYVTSTADHAVTLFSRNASSGALTQVAVYKDGVNGVDGLQAASSAKRSPDGKHLYVSGQGENSVAVFSIDSNTGELTYLDKMTKGVGGVDKLTGARSLAVSPDGRYVLASAITDDSVTVFTRDASTGLLTLNSVVTNNVNGVAGLDAPSGMSTDPLNRHLYVAGQSASSLVVFSLPTPAISLATNTATAQVQGSAVVLDNMLELFDSDSADLVSASVAINSGFINTDALSIQVSSGISASYNSLTGVLELTGIASLADYQTVLRSLSYKAGADPSLAPGASSNRVIGLQVTDPDGNTSATAVINVIVEKSAVSSFTLSYDSQGGSAVTAEQVVAGNGINLPVAPAYVGYSFIGWNTASNGTGITYGAGDNFVMPAADTTLYAQWVVNSYSITFNSAGGSSIDPVNYNFGAAVTAPTSPIRAGYTFIGWNPALPATMPAANTTVTAQWALNSYIITFDSAGGSAVAPITANFGSAIIAPAAPQREGYTFAGWSPALPATMPLNGATVTAQWTVNSYSITFDSAGGSAVAPITANFGSAITAPAAPQREGYTFAGWSPTLPATMPLNGATVKAQWTVNQYTLTFDSAGGSAVAAITADFGSAITTPAEPTREGYNFTNWSPVVPATMPAQNMTFTALYSVELVTVTATVTGEASISPASQQVPYGSTATINLSLKNADDIVRLSSSDNCAAALSGSSVVTAVLKADCAIVVNVYPNTNVEKDSTAPLVSNGVAQFRLVGGAGDKHLVQVSLLRAGVYSVLEQADAEALLTLQEDGSYLFSAGRTGRYTLEFSDVVSGELTEVTFDVLPYLAFTSSRQPVQQDVKSTLHVWLSDEPIEYPVTATLGTAGVSMTTQQIELTKQHQLRRTYDVTATSTTARVTLQSTGINNAHIGTPAVHDLIVQQTVPALALAVTATQNNLVTYVIRQTDGLVTLSASTVFPETVEYTWVPSGDLELQVANNLASFDPLSLADGRYSVKVTAKSADGREGQYELAFRVVLVCPFENCVGTSGIPASENAFAATPNRLPLCATTTQNNRVVSCQPEGSQGLYAEVPSQYQLTLGALSEEQSWSTGQFGITLNEQTLVDSTYEPVGPIINFDIAGLETVGEAISIAVPLLSDAVIPKNAVWRKYINGQWQNFVVDGANKLESAATNSLGLCPGVSSDGWSSGLVEGYACIRLTIEDGGPNDDDGQANGVIRDPGVLAVALEPTPPVPPKDIQAKSGGSLGGLSALVLVALAALRQRKLLLAAAMLPLSVSAQSVYLGADGLYVNSDTSNAKLSSRLAQVGIAGQATVDDDNRSGFRLYGGTKLTDSLAVEVGWLDLGSIKTHYTGLAATTSAQQLQAITPRSGKGLELSLLWQPVTYGQVTPGLRAGYWVMESKTHFYDGAEQTTKQQSENIPFIEAQVQWSLDQNWSLKFAASYYDVDNASIRGMQFGVLRRF